MMGLQQIKEELMTVKLSLVSSHTGVHYNTLLAIRDSKNANPTHGTLQKLSDYFGVKT